MSEAKSSLYSQIDSNKRKTFFIMFGFIVVVTSMAAFLAYVFGGSEAAYVFLPLALVFSLGSTVVSYYNSDKIVIATSGAKLAKGPEFNQLLDMVDNLSKVAGVPMPKVYYINDTALNAFATGRDYNNSAVVVTTGLVQTLNKQELEGVIAHELAHIKNYDIRLMATVAVLIGLVVLLSDWLLRSGIRRDTKDSGGISLLIALFLAILAPVALELIKLAISRNREYLADASGAYITRYPQGLADALKKISSDTEKLEAANRGTAHMYIGDPFKRKAATLFSTHPPVKERIKRLESM
jgi:heat shock protein HtpX